VSAEPEVRVISASDSRPLRQQVLRPSQTVEDVARTDDDHATYLGVFVDAVLVACASVSHEPPPGSADPAAWRLRGMATSPHSRGCGFGSDALRAAITQARAAGGGLLWCNARTPARPFYEKHGFVASGAEFDISGAGPHFLMSREI